MLVPLNMAQASNYSFEQTSWAGGDGTGSVVTHGFSGNRTKYDDASANLDLTTPTQLRSKITSSSVIQTNNGTTNTGFNLTGNTKSNVEVLPAGTAGEDASVRLSVQTTNVNKTYTGAQQTWTVPTGVTSVTVDMAGAKGGNAYASVGGNGGRVTTTLTVTSGSTLYIYAGGVSSSSAETGGYNGGGNGGAGGYDDYNNYINYGGGGGGASDIRTSGDGDWSHNLNTRRVVAAGGGGSGLMGGTGGNGGGTTGTTGGTQFTGGGGGGGSSSGGGSGGTSGGGYNAGTSGTSGIGGTGGQGYSGGGGGGGYYGGGGGGSGWFENSYSYYGGGGGGGGSSYCNASYCSSTTHLPGDNNGNGYVNISYSSGGYYSSGTFTSGIMDIGFNVPSWGNLGWDQTLNGGTIKFLLASSQCANGATNYPTCDSGTWVYKDSTGTTQTDCSGANCYTATGDGAKTQQINSVHNGGRYIRYQAFLISPSPYSVTPSLNSVTVNYNYYPTNQTLTSLPFNSTSKRDAVAKINVKGTLGASGTAIKVQVRSATTEGGLTSAQWCGSTSCNGTDVFNFTSPNADPGQTLNVSDSHPLKNGGDDQWFQYRVILDSTGAYTPTLESVALYYEFVIFVGTQTNWGSGVSSNDAVHPLSNNSPDDWRYYTSKSSSLGVVNGNGDLEVAKTEDSLLVTYNSTANTGFNHNTPTLSQTEILPAGTGGEDASVKLALDPSPHPYNLTGSTNDGFVSGRYQTSYSAARSTSAAYYDYHDYLQVGQKYVSPNYADDRSFLKFDTSAIPDGDTITQVNLKMVCINDYSTTDFDIQIVKQDWSAQDPLGSSNREVAYDNCLAGTADDNIWLNTSTISLGAEPYPQYTSGNLSTSWVNKTGSTYYSLRSSRDYNPPNGTTPTGNEYIQIAAQEHATEAYRPILTVLATGDYYYSSGTYTSGIIDPHSGVVPDWGQFSWHENLNGQNLTMEVRSCDAGDSDCSEASAWGSCTVTSGDDISSGNCVDDGDRYIQYRANMSGNTVATPELLDVTIGYNYYPTSSQNLVSSAFNSTADGNRIDELQWNEAVPSNTSVKAYLKSADSKANLSGATEYEFTNATSGCTKSGTTVTCPVDALSDALKDGTNDRWFQYKVILQTTDGLSTPTFSDIYIGYNADVSKIITKFRNFIRSFGTIKMR